MKQSHIVALLRKEFGHHEVTVFTASQKNKAGILDCEIAYMGRSFWLEIKIGKDTLKPMQRSFMRRHHLNAFCIHSIGDKFQLLYFPDGEESQNIKIQIDFELSKLKGTFEIIISEIL